MRTSIQRGILAALTALFSTINGLQAQSGGNFGTIYGTITDPTGGVIAKRIGHDRTSDLLQRDQTDPVALQDRQIKVQAGFTAINLTNNVALYNYLSTFSGTHYVTPRTLTGEVGFHF